MMLRAILKQDDNCVAVAQDIKDAFKRFILEDLLGEGGALFVPKVMADGQVNQLTGIISACQGEPGGEYDIRHPQFPGRAHLPPDVQAVALMPILRDLAQAELLAPAVTSDIETEDSVAYLKRSFAISLDAEVNNNTFNWEEITYGTNITQAVIDCLQPQFVRVITSAAREGLWVHRDLVVHGQDQQGSLTISYEQLEQKRRGLTKILATHPFQGGPLANKAISALIQTKTITVVGVAGAGIILTLPEMNDLIAILKEDDGTVAQVGEEIQYDQIRISQAVVQGVGREILQQLQQPKGGYMWLLAPPDCITETLTLQICSITTQHSALEEIQPVASDILPNSIWRNKGLTFLKALERLEKEELIQVFAMRDSIKGRQGLVALSADPGKTITETFEGMTNDDISDMLGEIDEPDLDEEESGVRLGDNKKMEAALTKIKMRVLMGALDDALTQPVVMQGVRIETYNLIGIEWESGEIDTNLDLAKKIGRENADEALLKCLGKKVRSQKFRGTHRVWNCVGGILILPVAMAPADSYDLASRIARWNPGTMQLEDIAQASAMVMEEEAPAEREVFTMQIMKAIATMGEVKSSQVLTPVRVEASSSFGRFQVDNAFRDSNAEWSVGLDYADPNGHIWILVTLEQEMTVTAIGTLPRQSLATKTFTKMQVQTPNIEMPANRLLIPEERLLHIAQLPQNITSQVIRIAFDKNGIAGEGDPPGFQGLVLLGRPPEGENASQGVLAMMKRADTVAAQEAAGHLRSLLEGLRAVGQVKGWQTQQIVFVGGTCGSVHVESFNKNMKALGVLESKWNPIRQKLVRRLLEEQDKVLRSYFAQKGGTRGQRGGGTHGQGREHVKWDMYV
jgi:hypothetical protein